jgi:hypothetical protein
MPSPILARLLDHNNEVNAATRPLTTLEHWLAGEMAYASWELDRVRANQSHPNASAALAASCSRASRNWNRARKELTAIQSARVNHAAIFSPHRQLASASAPLADPRRVPAAKRASSAIIDEAFQAMVLGTVGEEALRVLLEQEAR